MSTVMENLPLDIIELAVVLLGVLLATIERRHTRRRMAEINAGLRCVGCDAVATERFGNRIHCRACNCTVVAEALWIRLPTDAGLLAVPRAERARRFVRGWLRAVISERPAAAGRAPLAASRRRRART